RARPIMVGPVVAGTDVLHPLRWVREAGDALTRSARLEQENGGVAAVHQAARDHATRRPGAHDHVVVTSGQRLAALSHTMMLNHSRSPLHSECRSGSMAGSRTPAQCKGRPLCSQGMVSGSLCRFLGGTYAVLSVLTRIRNCPGVTPIRRL